MAVITISRQTESLGTEIAQEVAGKLHYKYLDKEGIEEGLTAHGLAVPEVEKFDEKSHPFWVNWQIQGRKFFRAIKTVIYEAARRDNVVILGRGGQVLLKGIPGVLHVRIIAPFPDRLQRLVARDGGDENELSRMLKQHDRDSGGFIRNFFDADWEDFGFYDLTINTRQIPIHTAVDMILQAIPAIEAMKDIQRFRERLDDLILEQKVEAVLLNMNLGNIHFKVVGGVVTLWGHLSSSREGESCVRLVSGIEGVQKVKDEMYSYKRKGM
jgi:cytidylate kinase